MFAKVTIIWCCRTGVGGELKVCSGFLLPPSKKKERPYKKSFNISRSEGWGEQRVTLMQFAICLPPFS